MKNLIKLSAIATLLFLASLPAQSQQAVDFSSAFVVPEKSSIGKIRIGGISVSGSPSIYAVDFGLQSDYSLAITNGDLLTSTQDNLEQSLRNTKWQGTYVIDGDTFTTELLISVVQGGYVGGEIIHTGTSQTGSLTVRVGGEIIKQYLINGAKYDEDAMTPAQIASAPSAPVGYIIRIKRTRAISYHDGVNNKWSTNREYRLSLNGSQLSGPVSVPGDTFGSGVLTSNGVGNVTLSKQ